MADAAIRAPRSLTEAQRLCEQYAQLDGEIAAIEEARDVAIAAANAEVDKDLIPLVARRAAIVEKLSPWWAVNAVTLTQGKRKSAELGGCVLKTQAGRASVQLRREADAIIADLRKTLDKMEVREARQNLGKSLGAPGGLIGFGASETRSRFFGMPPAHPAA